MTLVFRKQTFTGLGTKFNSFTPKLFKINAVKTLLFRCYALSSNWSAFHEEITFLKNFFQNNNYPLKLVENCIRNFLSNVHAASPKDDVTSNVHYVKLPYYGHLSFVMRKNLDQFFKRYFPDIKFNFIFSNTYTLKSFFPYKDSIPSFLISNVVYEYVCSSCKRRYIGETKRNLTLRFAEHKGVSARTGKPTTQPSFSQIRNHSQFNKHDFSENDFKILCKAQSPNDTRILESLFIKHMKPEINNQTTSLHLSIV